MSGPKLSDIAEALNNDPERFAPMIIGEAPNPHMSTANELRFYKKGGLKVKLVGAQRGNFTHHGHDKFGDLFDLIVYIHSVSKQEALEMAKGYLGITSGVEFKPAPRKSAEEQAAEQQDSINKRLRTARFIWSKSGTKIGAEADEYLGGRAITIHRDRKFASIRYRRLDRDTLDKMGIEEKGSPARFPNGLSALVFGATQTDGTITQVQQVILDGPKKADIENKKRSNGVLDQSAVRFGEPDEDLDLTEGPETGLSCVQATDVPTWATLGAANFTRMPIPDRVKRIRLAMEIEPSHTGIIASLKAAGHWMSRGKDVALAIPRMDEADRVREHLLTIPKVGGDANDVLKKFGTEAVKADFDRAVAPERHPFRKTDGSPLPAEEQAKLPVIFLRNAEDGLAVWRATGLRIVVPAKTNKQAEIKVLSEIHFPDNTTKILLILAPGEEEPSVSMPGDVEVRILRVTRSLQDIFQVHGGAVIRRLLRLNAKAESQQLVEIEELAIRPEAPVVVVNGRNAFHAAKELLPTAAVCGMPAKAALASFDWTALSGRRIYFAPANREEEVLAAEQAARDAAEAGASAYIVRWPAMQPVRSGYRARQEVPEGYDLRWLQAEGWSLQQVKEIFRAAEPILPVGLRDVA